MKLKKLLDESIDIKIPEEKIKRFLEENNIDYQEYPNSYKIYGENKIITVNFEKEEKSYFGKGIIIRNYEEKDYLKDLPLSDINDQQ